MNYLLTKEFLSAVLNHKVSGFKVEYNNIICYNGNKSNNLDLWKEEKTFDIHDILFKCKIWSGNNGYLLSIDEYFIEKNDKYEHLFDLRIEGMENGIHTNLHEFDHSPNIKDLPYVSLFAYNWIFKDIQNKNR